MISPLTGPNIPANPHFARRPGSIRRTTSISAVWPQGPGQPKLMTGEARDLITQADGATRVADEGRFEILTSPRREILTIATAPDIAALHRLVGERAGANLRLRIGAAIPHHKKAGTPLYQLLDDFCGASLVAPWAWSLWDPDWMRRAVFTAGRNGSMQGVCVGFAPGASSLDAHGNNDPLAHNATPIPDITNPEDPLAWHEMIAQEGTAVRRLRRLDIWREAGVLHANLHFQDSATTPQGGRAAVHEYLATATADAQTFELLSLNADPRILPYPECPAAVPLAGAMLGQKLTGFRASVLETLPGTRGCTHFNDVLRSLADLPALAATLAAAS